MKLPITILLILLLTILGSCSDEAQTPSIDESSFVEGLLTYNDSMVSEEISKLMADLTPQSDVHRSNLDKLIERIESQTDQVMVDSSCYACILTLPAQSELKLLVDSLDYQAVRIIDIVTPEDGKLRYRSMH